MSGRLVPLAVSQPNGQAAMMLPPWVARPGATTEDGEPITEAYVRPILTAESKPGVWGSIASGVVAAVIGGCINVNGWLAVVFGIAGFVLALVIGDQIHKHQQTHREYLRANVRVIAPHVIDSAEMAELREQDQMLGLLDLPADIAAEARRAMEGILWDAARHRSPDMLDIHVKRAADLRAHAVTLAKAYDDTSAGAGLTASQDAIMNLRAYIDTLNEITDRSDKE